jgi:para-nitrobenzyl esterase
MEAIKAGSAASVPLLTGINRDEWNLFAFMDRVVADAGMLTRRLGRFVEHPEPLIDVYRRARPGASYDEIFKAVMTDRVFGIPAVRMVEAQARHQPDHTFLYRFEYESTAFDGRLGSCHALEIPFVFDNLGRGGVELLTGPEPPQSLADSMHAAWISFARTGTPVHQGAADWPAYDEDGRATMIFGLPNHLEREPGAAERRAWAGLL